MKTNKITNLLLALSIGTTTQVAHGQEYERQANFKDGTEIKYTILENNPYTAPNFSFDIGVEIAAMPAWGGVASIVSGLQYRLPQKGKIDVFGALGVNMLGLTHSERSISDNPHKPFVTRLGGNVSIDFWDKHREKDKNVALKSKSSSYGRTMNYVVSKPVVYNYKLSIDGGYTLWTGVASNQYSKDLEIVSDEGVVLVDGDQHVHTTMRSHMFHGGISYTNKRHLRIISEEKRKRRPLKRNTAIYDEWHIYAHLLVAAHSIDPIQFSRNKNIDGRTIDAGFYNVQHSGIGGFRTNPVGGRIGLIGRSAMGGTSGFALKFEAAVLPGIVEYNTGTGPFMLSVTALIKIGGYVPRYEPQKFLD